MWWVGLDELGEVDELDGVDEVDEGEVDEADDEGEVCEGEVDKVGEVDEVGKVEEADEVDEEGEVCKVREGNPAINRSSLPRPIGLKTLPVFSSFRKVILLKYIIAY